MQKLSPLQKRQISDLESRLGSVQFRTLMTEQGNRLVEPKRLARWQGGRGRLSTAEADRLQNISTNSQAIQKLAAKNSSKRDYQVNRALRDWLTAGKSKGGMGGQTDNNRLRTIRALRFLGIDPSEGTYYVQKRKR